MIEFSGQKKSIDDAQHSLLTLTFFLLLALLHTLRVYLQLFPSYFSSAFYFFHLSWVKKYFPNHHIDELTWLSDSIENALSILKRGLCVDWQKMRALLFVFEVMVSLTISISLLFRLIISFFLQCSCFIFSSSTPWCSHKMNLQDGNNISENYLFSSDFVFISQGYPKTYFLKPSLITLLK